LIGQDIPPINLASSGNGGVYGELPWTKISGTPAFPVTTTAVTSEWLNSYNSTTGAFTQTQPAFSDISGTLTAAQEPSTTVNSVTNDTNIHGVISAQNLTLSWNGQLSVARGGTGTASPSLVAGTNVTITGSWPNQTVNASGGGGLPTSQTVTFTTSSLASLATASGTVSMAKSFLLLSVQVSSIARVRLYGTSASQVSDLTRPVYTPPIPGVQNALISDHYLTGTSLVPLDFSCSPVVVGSNADNGTGSPPLTQSSTIYYSVSNMGASAAAITVTLVFVPSES
jgi:hypothetical protein